MGPQSSVEQAIVERFSSLTRTQRKIAQYVLENPTKALSQDLNSLARATGSSRSSVLRFIHELGFLGLRDLQRQALKPATFNGKEDPLIRWLFESTAEAVKETYLTMNRKALAKAVDRCKEASRILWYGAGDSGFLAEMGNHRCWLLGINSGACTDEASLQGVSHTIDASQVVVVVSRSGNGDYLENALETIAKRDAFTIGITGSLLSYLARNCDIALIGRSREATIQDRFIPTRAGQELVVNALVLKTAQALGIPFATHDYYVSKPQSKGAET